MNKELKPCPFCGGTPYYNRYIEQDENGEYSDFVRVRCSACDCRSGAVKYNAKIHGEVGEYEEARGKWNRRAARMENKCVCCGADIPEGVQACPNCQIKAITSAAKAAREKAVVGKGVCKWYKDDFCVNADCPYVADFCPVAQDDSICKFRE